MRASAYLDPATGHVGFAEPVASGPGERIAEDFRWSWVLDQLDHEDD
jgi:hypothetical protein